MGKKVGTWIYYDKKGNQLSKIQHNQQVRQNNAFTLFVAFDTTVDGLDTEIFDGQKAKYIGLKAFIRKPSETEYSNITYADSHEGKLVKFEKISDNEMTYGLVDGKEYIVYELNFETVNKPTNEYGNINIDIRTHNFDAIDDYDHENEPNYKSKSLGTVDVYVQPTYNNDDEDIGDITRLNNRIDERVKIQDGKSLNQQLFAVDGKSIVIDGNVDTTNAKFSNPVGVDNPNMPTTKEYVDNLEQKIKENTVENVAKTEKKSTLDKTHITKIINGVEEDIEIPLPSVEIEELIDEKITLANHVTSIEAFNTNELKPRETGIRYQTMKDQTNHIVEVKIPLSKELVTKDEENITIENSFSKKNLIKDIKESDRDLQVKFVDYNSNEKIVNIKANSLVNEKELSDFSTDLVAFTHVANSPDEPATYVDVAKTSELAEHAITADFATNSTTAESATKDGNGKVINENYLQLQNEEATIGGNITFENNIKLNSDLVFESTPYPIYFYVNGTKAIFETEISEESAGLRYITWDLKNGKIGLKNEDLDDEKTIDLINQVEKIEQLQIDAFEKSNIISKLNDDIVLLQEEGTQLYHQINGIGEENATIKSDVLLLQNSLNDRNEELENLRNKKVFAYVSVDGFEDTIFCPVGGTTTAVVADATTGTMYACKISVTSGSNQAIIDWFFPLNGAPIIDIPTVETTNVIKVGDL